MLIHINSLHDWENLIEKSKDGSVIILKDSNACAVSSTIRNMIKQAIDDGKLLTPVHMVIVQEKRDISNQIEADTAVKHETPQIIILRSGHSVYHASHYAITIEDMNDALERNK